MIITYYNTQIHEDVVVSNLTRIGNLIYKLLPMREEQKDWKKPLETLVVELLGMNKILPTKNGEIFSIACKLRGILEVDDDFMSYRRTIFECCGLIDKVKNNVILNNAN